VKRAPSVTLYRTLFFLAIGALYLAFVGKPRGHTAAALLRQYAPAGEQVVTNEAVAPAEVGLVVADLAVLPGGFYRLASNAVCGAGCATIWIRPDRQIWLCPDRAVFQTKECWVLVRCLPGPALLAELGRDRPLADLVEQFGSPRSLAVTRRGPSFLPNAVRQLTATWQSLGEGPDGTLGAIRVEYDLVAKRGHWLTVGVRTALPAVPPPG
jgi:hypothetical protein